MDRCNDGMCSICGDDLGWDGRKGRYWSPDDGWVWGRMCGGCYEDLGNRKPHPDDYAFPPRGMTDDEEQSYIDTMLG